MGKKPPKHKVIYNQAWFSVHYSIYKHQFAEYKLYLTHKKRSASASFRDDLSTHSKSNQKHVPVWRSIQIPLPEKQK